MHERQAMINNMRRKRKYATKYWTERRTSKWRNEKEKKQLSYNETANRNESNVNKYILHGERRWIHSSTVLRCLHERDEFFPIYKKVSRWWQNRSGRCHFFFFIFIYSLLSFRTLALVMIGYSDIFISFGIVPNSSQTWMLFCSKNDTFLVFALKIVSTLSTGIIFI